MISTCVSHLPRLGQLATTTQTWRVSSGSVGTKTPSYRLNWRTQGIDSSELTPAPACTFTHSIEPSLHGLCRKSIDSVVGKWEKGLGERGCTCTSSLAVSGRGARHL
ncbi:hypothetical protein PoB_001788500 [Plakobranchus ocellatus]|uniref:Uncharacterized protein n=1 Tax=Plakobranchus ocellatus TaxID=259542 RepID=A0AAV3Z8A3_9GAST|nr:hypothetical protein PoB_001788500 [Plakobranchus ocellatus]